ncbi:SHOCT domain-containing protein [Hanstruepera ponticola]|uniref:SHOCT domain-containing protein n=1 Tax=Hanstruepera ponticola TaxID=2042995 RepID=UPI000CF06298|nr:SHOCT domain-containing protein [Hanstruepera ponticola]
MKLFNLFVVFIFPLICGAQVSYKTDSGIIFNIGDTLRIGSPLSHLGWKAIFRDADREKNISNKNFIDKEIVIKSIDTINKPVNFKFIIYRKEFIVNIDDAIRNKEIILQYNRSLAKRDLANKYELLKTIKDFLDNGTITKEEYEIEKQKILNSDN